MKHVNNNEMFTILPCVVAIPIEFLTDTKAELDLVEENVNKSESDVALSEVWAKGGEEVPEACRRSGTSGVMSPSDFPIKLMNWKERSKIN